jgi:hypothetical protein
MKIIFSKPAISLRSAIAFLLILVSIPLHPAVLSWDFNQDRDAAGFIIYFGKAPGVYTDTIDAGKTFSYEISGLTSGSRYYFTVTSYDSCYNQSPCSGELSYLCSKSTGTENRVNSVPGSFGLNQNYPNPFNPETRIEFTVMEPGPTVVSVFDIMGKRIRVLFDGEIPTPGAQQDLLWNGTDGSGNPVASGTYLVCLQQGRRTDTRRMQLVR